MGVGFFHLSLSFGKTNTQTMKKYLHGILMTCFIVLFSVTIFANSPKTEFYKSASYQDTPDTTFWKSEGYGYLLGISGNTATLYDITSISIVKTFEYQFADGFIYIDDQPLGTIELGTGEILINVGQQYTFKKWDDAKTVIGNLAIKEDTDDPLVVFDVFWQTFEEHCVLFDIAGVDWHAARETYRPAINETTTDEELFLTLSEMIEPLNDGHTSIEIPGTGFQYSPGPEYEAFWIEDVGTMITNITGYLDPEEMSAAAGGRIFCGKTPEQIGYLNIVSMDDLAAGSEAENVAVVKHVMDSLMVAWSDCKGIIIDVRLNGGGYDIVSNAFAGYFTGTQVPAYTKYIRNGGYNEFLDPLPFYIEPAEAGFFEVPVYLLTSNFTASASDVFAMVMSGFPQVTVVGEHTYGIFSDRLDKLLPNGWAFSLSNEKYLSADQVNYEQQGITPDVELAMDEDDFNAGRDNVLEYALNELTVLFSATTVIRNEVQVRSYPNPFTDQVTFESSAADPISQVVVYSMTGETVAAFSDLNDPVFEWKASALQPGVYICNVRTENSMKTMKLVKR